MATTVTVMLLGKTGAGKSSLGNAICRLKVSDDNFHFKEGTRESLERLTTEAQMYATEGAKLRLQVIDTPGFFDTELEPRQRWMDILKAVKLTGKPLDAVIFVVHTKQVKSGAKVMTIIQENVSDLITDRMIVVFNHDSTLTTNDRLNAKKEFNSVIGQGTLGAKVLFMNVKHNDSRDANINKLEEHLKEIKLTAPPLDVTNVFKSYTKKVLEGILLEKKQSVIDLEDLNSIEKLDMDLLKEVLLEAEILEVIESRNDQIVRRELRQKQEREKEEKRQRDLQYQQLRWDNLKKELEIEREKNKQLEKGSCVIL